MTIELYCLPNSTEAIVAYHTDTATWEIFPAVQGGYEKRRDWHPAPAQERLIKAADKHGQTYRASLLEIQHQAVWLGLPAGKTKSKFDRRNDAQHGPSTAV